MVLTDKAAPPDAAVELRGLAKSYPSTQGVVRAVRGIDVSIALGQTVALLGPNGAGKSTTVDMLLGLTKPDSGTVSVLGMPPPQAIATGAIGAMLQTGGLIRDLTVLELVAMVASLYPAPLDVDEVLDVAGVEEIAAQRTQKLSGGQTQRVRFAVALVSNPDLLVLDEPTVGMDVEARHAFWMTMRSFAARGKTVVFATHYLEEADAYADRAVLMSNGRIAADGTTSELKATVGLHTIRATLPDADLGRLAELPGVTNADRRGETVILNCFNSDVAVVALLSAFPAAHDIEISRGSLEEVFLQLTGNDDERETMGPQGANQ